MTRAPFPRAARLLTPADFARLRGISHRIGSQSFAAEVAPAAPTAACARLGLAVSRRVSKRAVRRNRIKRIARDSFRHHRAALPTCDILLIARSDADQRSNAELRAELERLWQRVAALNDTRTAGTMRA
jgi:ribonuclease P protein component